MSSHRLNFVFVVSVLAVGCGSSVNGVTPSCDGENEEQVGNTCQPRSDPKPDGACKANKDCDDGSECTLNDRCVADKCYYGDACDDGDVDTEDACLSWQTGACSHTPIGSTSTTSTSSGGGTCVPETNADGSVLVTLHIQVTAEQAQYVTVHDDWSGGWPATTYSGDTVFTVEGVIKGLHKANVRFGDGTFLVEGLPSLHLTVPESWVQASFGGCSWIDIEPFGSNGLMSPNSLAYGWFEGDAGPNIAVCAGTSSCAAAGN